MRISCWRAYARLRCRLLFIYAMIMIFSMSPLRRRRRYAAADILRCLRQLPCRDTPLAADSAIAYDYYATPAITLLRHDAAAHAAARARRRAMPPRLLL